MNRRRLCALVLGLSIAGLAGGQTKQKVILDTDIGDDIDDAWALAFVLSHDAFEPVGVTMAHGNTVDRARMACKMLHVAGRRNIPVAVGRKTGSGRTHQFAWAEDFEALKPISQSAPSFIVENIKRFPGEITLIAVGPLQNVADALRQEPNLGKYVKRVVLMSGCIYGSARKPEPQPEWNVRASIPDAQIVYAAGLPLTIVPLDSTTFVRLNDDERQRVAGAGTPLTFALESLYRLWLGAPTSRMTVHDQLAVGEAAATGRFFGKKETLRLVVDDKGFTRIDAKGQPVVVCLEPKRDEFMQYYISELTWK
jgi:inosine-uridine nucleoside N-ribohydrolase